MEACVDAHLISIRDFLLKEDRSWKRGEWIARFIARCRVPCFAIVRYNCALPRNFLCFPLIMVANAVNINARPALKIKATRASGAKPTSVHAQRSKKVALPTTIAIGKSVWAIQIYKLYSIFTSEMELVRRFPPHEITSVRIIDKPNWSEFYRLRDHR